MRKCTASSAFFCMGVGAGRPCIFYSNSHVYCTKCVLFYAVRSCYCILLGCFSRGREPGNGVGRGGDSGKGGGEMWLVVGC